MAEQWETFFEERQESAKTDKRKIHDRIKNTFKKLLIEDNGPIKIL